MATFPQRIEVGTIDSSRSKKAKGLGGHGSCLHLDSARGFGRFRHLSNFPTPLLPANGAEIERDCTQASVKVDGSQLITVCVFGDEGSEPLLGAVTLEEMGLGSTLLINAWCP
jgi:hypothetical protein